jgi:uncharacterized protein (TIGR02646 family)
LRQIEKQEPPTELETQLKTPGATFEGCPIEVKRAIRRDCMRDQYGICCYCCGPLSEDSSHQQIEHIVAQAVDPTRTLDWTNLLISCASGRPEVSPTKRGELTCDDHKGSDRLPITPLDAGCESRFRYVPETGQIVTHGQDAEAKDTIRILNLDCARLRGGRREAMEEASRFANLRKEEWIGRFLEPQDGRLIPFQPAVKSLLRERLFVDLQT